MRKFQANILFIILIQSLTGCVTPVGQQMSSLELRTFEEIRDDALSQPIERFAFFSPGPFTYVQKRNHVIPLSLDTALTLDAFVPNISGKSPLVIFVHGNFSAKEAHRLQAEQLASWGFHTAVLGLPNRGVWLENGERVSELVEMLNSFPRAISRQIDASSIILVGHSFGGSAVTIAAGLGAPVKAVILLDPAMLQDSVIDMASKIAQPAVVLGADPVVFRSRKRSMFYKSFTGPKLEVSIPGATHDDAQFPSMFSLHAFGIDPYTARDTQRQFLGALTLSALGLTKENGLDVAKEFFAAEQKEGKMAELHSDLIGTCCIKNEQPIQTETPPDDFLGEPIQPESPPDD